MISELLISLVQLLAIGTFVLFMLFVYPARGKNKNTIKLFFENSTAALYTIAFIITYLLMFRELFLRYDSYNNLTLLVFGTAIACFGLVMAFSGRVILRKVWSPITKTHKSEKIISTGPFAITRHPIYVGRLAFFLGVTLMFNLYLLIVFVVYWLLIRSKAKKEEQTLLQSNKNYKAYMKRVPRLF